MTHLTGIRCSTKKSVKVPACKLPGAWRLAGGCLLRETSPVWQVAQAPSSRFWRKKHQFFVFAGCWISLCKCGVKGTCCCLEVLKSLVSCLGFCVYEESKNVCLCSESWIVLCALAWQLLLPCRDLCFHRSRAYWQQGSSRCACAGCSNS